MTTTTQLKLACTSRKLQRRQERQQKKQKRSHRKNFTDSSPHQPSHQQQQEEEKEEGHPKKVQHPNDKTRKTPIASHNNNVKKNKSHTFKKQEIKSITSNNTNKHKSKMHVNIDPTLQAQLQRDEEEIERLEYYLGIRTGKKNNNNKRKKMEENDIQETNPKTIQKNKQKLQKEYASLEGYGEDFGEFLDSLDDMMKDILHGSTEMNDDDEEEEEECDDEEEEEDSMEDENSNFHHDSVEDEEDSHDENDYDDQYKNDKEEHDSESEIEEGSNSEHEEYNVEEEEEYEQDSHQDVFQDEDTTTTTSEDIPKGTIQSTRDHEEQYTYKPLPGQDLYGNTIHSQEETKKYIPPHKRLERQKNRNSDTNNHHDSMDSHNLPQDPNRNKTLIVTSQESSNQQQALNTIRRSLNNHLNRLSDTTLESVVKSISELYSIHPTHDVNQLLWENIRQICVPPHIIMSGLIPVYMTCIAALHYHGQVGTLAQCGSFLLEVIVVQLLEELQKGRTVTSMKDEENIANEENQKQEQDHHEGEVTDGDNSSFNLSYSKHAPNLILLLCYLYNFHVVHCTLMYDIIRDLIQHFTEVDVEVLLLIVSHSGYQLRSDDPMALKEIVLLVKQRADTLLVLSDRSIDSRPVNAESAMTSSLSSRLNYMITAITDLKNNKKKQKDIVLAEKITMYRKILGRIKSSTSQMTGKKMSMSTFSHLGGSSSSSSSLRISLMDIINIKEKGRWWKIGASWLGNQFHGQEHTAESCAKQVKKTRIEGQGDQVVAERVLHTSQQVEEEKEQLLQLAVKQRMNSDIRRTIFCVIMGSDDYEDAFTKIVKANLMKGTGDREVVRVLIDCCIHEKSYNPFYSYLGVRLCEYNPKCKFTFQLALWDSFQVLEEKSRSERKACNLAKLMAFLMKQDIIKLNTLRMINMSPDEISNQTVLFLTVLFTDLFETVREDQISNLIIRGGISTTHVQRESKKRKRKNPDDMYSSDDNEGSDSEIVRKNASQLVKDCLSIFFTKYLESSPKNMKKSQFRTNLKAALKACDRDDLDNYV